MIWVIKKLAIHPAKPVQTNLLQNIIIRNATLDMNSLTRWNTFAVVVNIITRAIENTAKDNDVVTTESTTLGGV